LPHKGFLFKLIPVTSNKYPQKPILFGGIK
jgi:hypothetical protein